ncbi:WD domain G-beta repeat family protein [Babesia bovis T2Bo]|uniref:Uncharacterized protein n=1 Tax=Babesia bovis TaxID=5865 RepID=A7ASS1_BABBO|nr:WD domain G-beta repeat family protein [Babesia bovis T2Bo]EDO05982.1 WD domain G-beta repeat family protein [Babesia bovis T2Bo]|eukprot:XP_001609550.1 hypothetical protein [Babesia bovis T2Bo]
MGTVKLLEYPVYALATDGQYLVTSGGGGGEEYGISDRVEFYTISDLGRRAELFQKGSLVDQVGVLDSVEFIDVHNLWMGSVSNGTVFFSYRPSNGVHVYGRVLIATTKIEPQQTVARFCRGKKIFITGNTDGTVCMWQLSNRFMAMMDELENNLTDATGTSQAHMDTYAHTDDLTQVDNRLLPLTVRNFKKKRTPAAMSGGRQAESDIAGNNAKQSGNIDNSGSSKQGDSLRNERKKDDTKNRQPQLPMKGSLGGNTKRKQGKQAKKNASKRGYKNSEVTEAKDEHNPVNDRVSEAQADRHTDSNAHCSRHETNDHQNVAIKVAEYKCHEKEVTDCDICHDGKIAISVSQDKMVIYQVDPSKILFIQKSSMFFKFARFINSNCQNGFYQFLTIEWNAKRPCESLVAMWRFTAEVNKAVMVKSSSLGQNPCSAMCLSGDEINFALGFGTGDVGVYDVRSLQCLVYEQRHQLPVTDLAFLGDKLVSSGADFYVVIKSFQTSYIMTILTIVIPIIAYLIYVLRYRQQ